MKTNTKRIIAVLLSAILMLSLSSITAFGAAEDFDNTWTAITTATELKSVIEADMTGNYYLANDIDISASAWLPIGWIGSDDVHFTGTFDGDGHTITGLNRNGSNDTQVGLFAIIGEGGTIRNVNLAIGYVSSYGPTGSVAGQNFGTISKVNVTNKTSSSAIVATGSDGSSNNGAGGIVGVNRKGGVIEDCTTAVANVAALYFAGGIAGENYGTITRCKSNSNVNKDYTKSSSTRRYAGGIAGRSIGDISDCIVSGSTICGNGYVAGICGRTYGGTVTRCVTSENSFVYNTGANYSVVGIAYAVGEIKDGEVSEVLVIHTKAWSAANGTGTTFHGTTDEVVEYIETNEEAGWDPEVWVFDSEGAPAIATIITEDEACTHTGETEIKNAAAADCITAGYTGDTYCKTCKALIAKGTEIEALGHDWEVFEEVAPTCEEDGYIVYKCTVCKEINQGQARGDLYPRTGHINTEIINAAEATCTAVGYTGDTYCNDCETIIAAGEEIPMIDHTITTVGAVEATCTADGYTGDSYCTACQQTVAYGEVIKAPGHNPSDVAEVPATCTQAGTHAGVICSVCQETISGFGAIEAIAHSYTDFVETIEPTATEQGYTVYKCSGCDATETRDFVPAKGTVDFTEIDKAIDEVDAATEGKDLSDEAREEIESIKERIEELKNDTDTNQADNQAEIDELTNRVHEIVDESQKDTRSFIERLRDWLISIVNSIGGLINHIKNLFG